MFLKLVLIAAFLFVLYIGFAKGFIGLAGATVYKSEQPALFWAQMGLVFAGLIILIVIVATEFA